MGGVGSGQFGPLEAFNIQQFIYLKGKSINNGQIGFVHYGWPQPRSFWLEEPRLWI